MQYFKIGLIAFCLFTGSRALAQPDIDSLLNSGENIPQREFVNNAFKSTRVIMGHSMEMLGKGVLDFRILHRFGSVKNGAYDLFGLDQATMRMSFDYAFGRNLMVGVGRSTRNKELDGFIKYRVIQQSRGKKSFPFSILAVAGATMITTKWADPARVNYFSSRLAYYGQLILGKKMGEGFTLQVAPLFVHRNLIELDTDKNDMVALGVGARVKLSNRMAFIIDAFPQVYGARAGYHQIPVSVGLDIETGGHVFQLHFTNTQSMNERAFLTETTQTWQKGEIHFGFNLSRVFTVKKNKSANF